MDRQTFACLLARWSLSILFASYKLARAAYLEPLTWSTAQEKLRDFSSLVPCLEANLRLLWSEMCYSSDASLSGGAFAVRCVPLDDISRISRLRENVDSSVKKQPPDLVNTRIPYSRQVTQ